MVEILLTGSATVVRDHTSRGENGKAEYAIENRIETDIDITARKEYPDGYVNLEGYVLSEHWATTEDLLRSFDIEANPAFEGWTIDTDSADVEVSMHGGPAVWLQQAVCYVSERPNLSIMEALQRFASWDETADGGVERAIQKIESTLHANDPVGGLTDDEYRSLVSAVHNAISRTSSHRDVMQYAP